jgi:hypothetical protein
MRVVSHVLRNEQCHRGERSVPHIPRIAQSGRDHTKSLLLIVAIDLGLRSSSSSW